MQCLSLALRCHKNVKRPNECNNKLQSSSQRAIIDAFCQEPRFAHLGTFVGYPRIARHTAHVTRSTLHVDIELQTPHPRQTLNVVHCAATLNLKLQCTPENRSPAIRWPLGCLSLADLSRLLQDTRVKLVCS